MVNDSHYRRFMHPSRMLRCGIVLKPSTLLHFHHLLTKRKYHMLFSSKRRGRPGPKGPAQELIDAVVEMKRRNPTWGCPRIAQQITLVFGVDIDKDVVRLENITGESPDLAVRLGWPFSVRRRTSMIRTCQGKTHISSDLSEGFPARLQSLGRRFARICQIGSVEDWANASA
jgi:hypothetical protein